MTDDEIRAAWESCGGDFLIGSDRREFVEAWTAELIAFARDIAAAEREECAIECEKWGHRKWEDYEESGNSYVEGQADCAFGLADAIRARSET